MMLSPSTGSENLEDDLWHDELATIPPRSRLFHLEPVGVGTPLVESLTSYFIRLADAHSVAPVNLIREVLPLFKDGKFQHVTYKAPTEVFNLSTWALNGTSSRAIELVNSLQTLTARQDLRALTLLPLAGILNTSRDCLFHKYRRWCPFCYEDWRVASKTIYEPLLWSIKHTDVCLKHKKQLQDRCPHCMKATQPLMGYSRPGCCAKCQNWLGIALESHSCDDEVDTSNTLLWSLYVAATLGEAIANASYEPSLFCRKIVVSAISTYIENLSEGNMSRFCRLVDLPDRALREALTDGTPPMLQKLLKICHKLNIGLVDFLTAKSVSTNNLLSFQPAPKKLEEQLKRSIGKRVDKEELQLILEAAVEENPPPLITEVVNRTHYIASTVRNYFPELYESIKNRSGQWVDKPRIERIIAEALEENPPPPLTTVAERTGFCVQTVRKYFSKECHRIIERVNQSRDERIQAALIAAADENPPPALAEVARRLGYSGSSSYIRRVAPDACKIIIEHYNAHRNHLARLRIEHHIAEVKEVIERLSLLGKPFTKYTVKVNLQNPHIIRKKYIQEMLRDVLQ
ncbi:TniQ family protein [Leptolyngbya ohadii]|uniref:TniQ family protein n=1 Tax=Leptolyngbya ohadii TaxID=1962290 RepID=UPI000B59C344|nr:TniQ family protein [Leptolyngbya ohadii]